MGYIVLDTPAFLSNLIRGFFSTVGRIFNSLLKPIYATFDAVLLRLTNGYPPFLDNVLQHRGKFLGATLVLFVLAVVSVPFLGTELIPEMSQGEFFVDILLPIGTPLEETEVSVAEMAAMAQKVAGVASVYTVSGTAAQMGFSATELRENLGQLHIRLERRDDREVEQRVMDDLRNKFVALPGVEYKLSRPTLFSFKTPVEVEVRGYNLEELERLSLTLAQEIRKLPGLRDVKSSTEGGNPEVQSVFNRRRVAQAGLDIATICNIVRNKVLGEVSTELNRQDRKVDSRARAREEDGNNDDGLRRRVVNPSGE